MIERIKINEERLNKVSSILNRLECILDEFEKVKIDYDNLNNYYGSTDWFSDKENFEKGMLIDLKAGVLSEDAVWNLNEEMHELAMKMKDFSNKI